MEEARHVEATQGSAADNHIVQTQMVASPILADCLLQPRDGPPVPAHFQILYIHCGLIRRLLSEGLIEHTGECIIPLDIGRAELLVTLLAIYTRSEYIRCGGTNCRCIDWSDYPSGCPSDCPNECILDSDASVNASVDAIADSVMAAGIRINSNICIGSADHCAASVDARAGACVKPGDTIAIGMTAFYLDCRWLYEACIGNEDYQSYYVALNTGNIEAVERILDACVKRGKKPSIIAPVSIDKYDYLRDHPNPYVRLQYLLIMLDKGATPNEISNYSDTIEWCMIYKGYSISSNKRDDTDVIMINARIRMLGYCF